MFATGAKVQSEVVGRTTSIEFLAGFSAFSLARQPAPTAAHSGFTARGAGFLLPCREIEWERDKLDFTIMRLQEHPI
jgi:hypothetical protein